jgi:hypothetical protein
MIAKYIMIMKAFPAVMKREKRGVFLGFERAGGSLPDWIGHLTFPEVCPPHITCYRTRHLYSGPGGVKVFCGY